MGTNGKDFNFTKSMRKAWLRGNDWPKISRVWDSRTLCFKHCVTLIFSISISMPVSIYVPSDQAIFFGENEHYTKQREKYE